MDSVSLKFLDQEIEAKFQNANENKFKLQCEWLIFSFVIGGSLSTIMEGVKRQYLTMGLSFLYVIFLLFIYFALQRSLKFFRNFQKILRIINFTMPASILILSINNVIELQTGIGYMIMTIFYAPLHNQSYNIIQDAILVAVVLSLSIVHISYYFGFTPYYFVIIGPLIQFIFQRYSQIMVERNIFSQSLVNQSLVDVITKVCKENIIIFTYNLEQHKYTKEIINETAQSYFNTDILGNILRDIHIKNQPTETDVSSFVFRNCIQQSKRGEFKLKAYYKSKTNKILITLYVAQYLNIQIILKIEKQSEKVINIRKARQLINFQLCFLQNLLKKFSECFKIQEGIDIPQFKFYNYLHKSIIYNKLQILSMAKSTQIIIQTCNLEQMIRNIIKVWNLKYFFKLKQMEIIETQKQLQDFDSKTIYSSKTHLELLLHVVAISLRKLILNQQEFILIELVYYQDIIELNFNFNSKKVPSKISFLKDNLAKLIWRVGIQESLQFQENRISFKILKQLNEFG